MWRGEEVGIGEVPRKRAEGGGGGDVCYIYLVVRKCVIELHTGVCTGELLAYLFWAKDTNLSPRNCEEAETQRSRCPPNASFCFGATRTSRKPSSLSPTSFPPLRQVRRSVKQPFPLPYRLPNLPVAVPPRFTLRPAQFFTVIKHRCAFGAIKK